MLFKFLTIVPVIALLTSCGFSPLHKQNNVNHNSVLDLQKVVIAPIPERIGQLLRIELFHQLTPYGAPEVPVYTLNITITETSRNLGVRKDTTETRTDLIVKAFFKLIDLSSNKIVFVGSARSVISYNILDADFATMSVMSDAKKRAAKDLATEIRSRLSVIGN